MAKIHGFKFVLVLVLSILINLFFLFNHFVDKDTELSWSKAAAREAELVASISCSGHGRAYLDGIPFQGEPICECNSCYGGKDCSEVLTECLADADSGDPLFLEPFWMQHAASSAVVVAGWHRMSYRFDDYSSISEELEKHIRQLHAVIGNAVTDGRFILFGAGSTQLLNAALFGLSLDDSPSPANIVASIPFYPLYEAQTKYFNSMEFKWQGDASLWKNRSDSSGTFVEFVTSPNNPDGRLMKQVLKGPSSKTIFDHAYYWPHFSAIQTAADEDLMIFTLSKLTGHAGEPIWFQLILTFLVMYQGYTLIIKERKAMWALVRDENIYKRMQMYISLSTKSVSRDTQLRALKLLKVVLKENGKDLFEFGPKTMRNRWERISRSFSTSKRFSLQKLEPQYCNYFQNFTGPSPAYAWIKCERAKDQDCNAVLKTASIIGRGGSTFNAESRYVRLSLIKSQDDFDLLIQNIDALVSKEGGVAYI
ncbi:hypothetical protein IFM89_001598 [Coptis chinensis]|uniref:Uncharacterized protein n=1 Tax=Coptis chinensis TaxID=261450 RepID=A0A835HJV6_9MAGN|nr:hypothetical protein IFM89_001598 [Coptis chinensis]